MVTHLIFVGICILSIIGIVICCIKCSIAIYAAFLCFGVSLLLSIYTGSFYADTIHYRDRHDPTFEDFQNGKASIDTVIINSNYSTDTTYQLSWIGIQTGSR